MSKFKILNSRIFQLFPYYLSKKILNNLNYFKKTNLLHIPENSYPLSIKDLEQNISKENKKLSNFFHSCHYLPALLRILFNNKKFNFLDYGAGNLKNYYYLLNFFNNIQYYFKDQDIVEKYIIKKKFNLKNFNIYKKQKNISFLYFGSSFQYIENGEQILENITKHNKPKYILLSAINVYEGKSEKKIIYQQNNIVNKKIYLYFYNKDYLINLLKNKNYNLVYCLRNISDNYLNYKNLEKKNFEYCDLLFEKKFKS
tara:strand:- start:226 stop:993 length:768 start_codon:yes stop_codon:yes gene_type:complete